MSIIGHVKRPGQYHLQKNMTLYDLIFKSGGYIDEEYKKRTYLKRAELIWVDEQSDDKKIIPFNLGSVLRREDISSIPLRADDKVRIYGLDEIEGKERYVSIDGHVKSQRYELYEGNMSIYDLIFKAGGFQDEEFKKLTYLDRADLN